MDKETMRELVCRFVYGTKYNPDTFRQIDWDEIVYRFEHEPGGESIKLINENKVNYIRQEYVLLEDAMKDLKEMMLQLETKHEKWLVDNEGVFRYRDYKSIEGKAMMEGPTGLPIEDWLGYFYNSMAGYKAYMSKQLGIAGKGDIGEENVANVLAESEYAEYIVHNVVLDVADEGGNTNEIDTFVILPYGVAVLEVKNYCSKGQTLVITDAPEWDVYVKNRKIGQKKNPAYQNSRHTRATKLTLRKLLGRDIPIFPVIVIGNNEAGLQRQSSFVVKNIDELVPYLNSLTGNEHLKKEERIQIKKFLETEDIGANAFTVNSYRKQINHMKAIVKEVFPAACFNQEGKVLYYKIQDMVSYGLIGLIMVVLIVGAFILHNFDGFMVLLLGVCLLIVAVAGVVHIGGKVLTAFKKTASGGS